MSLAEGTSARCDRDIYRSQGMPPPLRGEFHRALSIATLTKITIPGGKERPVPVANVHFLQLENLDQFE